MEHKTWKVPSKQENLDGVISPRAVPSVIILLFLLLAQVTPKLTALLQGPMMSARITTVGKSHTNKRCQARIKESNFGICFFVNVNQTLSFKWSFLAPKPTNSSIKMGIPTTLWTRCGSRQNAWRLLRWLSRRRCRTALAGGAPRRPPWGRE